MGREHNLQDVDVEIGDGLTVVTGVSGSGKTSLAFDTLYHEARRRFMDVFALGSPEGRLAPALVREIEGLGPAVAVGQNLLNRNPASTVASASGLHPLLRLLYARASASDTAPSAARPSVLERGRAGRAPGRTERAGAGQHACVVPLVRDVPGQPPHAPGVAGGRVRQRRAAQSTARPLARSPARPVATTLTSSSEIGRTESST